jgi:cell division protein FtsL
MIKLLNVMLVVLTLISGTAMYSLEHATRGMEREINALGKRIQTENEQITLLHAEWASLTRPERLHMLATKKIGLKPLTSANLIRPSDIAFAIPDRPIDALAKDDVSPLSELLEGEDD